MKKIIIIFILLSAIFITSAALAQTSPQATSDPKTSGSVPLTNPLTGNQTSIEIPVLIGRIIKAVLGIVGSLALVMFIYGGFMWMTSAGNSEQVQKGKNILIWAALGLAVIFSSYALVKFVIEGITNKS